jgi:hypothetical protein
MALLVLAAKHVIKTVLDCTNVFWFSLATHLGELVIIPVVSSLVWLQFLRLEPHLPTFCLSSSVSAYFGAYAVLWAPGNCGGAGRG